MLEYAVAWDFETDAFGPDYPAPETVCMSFMWLDPRRLTAQEPQLVPAAEGHALLASWVRDPRILLIGANSSYDVIADYTWGHDVHRKVLWRHALEANRVDDVLLRQGYWDLSVGEFWSEEWYSLEKISLVNLRTRLDKDDELRRSFGALKGLPISAYSKRQIDYAKADSWATGWNWIRQEENRRKGSPYFPGLDPFRDVPTRVRSSVALKTMSNTGMRTNGETVDMFEANVRGEIERLKETLIPAGYVKRKLTRTTGAPAAYCERMGIKPPKSFGAKDIANHPDPVIRHYRDEDPPRCVIDAGLIRESFHDADKTVTIDLASCLPPDVQAYYDWKELRFTCFEGLTTKQRLAHPLTDRLEELRVNLTPKFALKVDSDACQRSPERSLRAFGRYSGRKYTLTNPIALARKHRYVTLHPGYRDLVATGRTSTTPNVQNMKREPGVRECWAAPPGWVIVEGDFAGVELCSFGDICKRVLGWSCTADALNSGRDLHTEVGAALMGLTYDQGAALKAVDDFEFKRARTAGKGVNFGAKGGMRARTFVQYCWNNYRIEITRQRAEELLALHARICKEFPLYSERYAQAFARDPKDKWNTLYDIVQPGSGRLRAGCRFTDAHNSPFQGYAGDLAAETLWALYLETEGVGPLGTASPLYGCRLYLFVHDSFAVLAPYGRHTAAALRLQEVAESVGRRVFTYCPPKVDLVISKQLSKKAHLIKLPDGTFGVWELWEQIRKVVPAKEAKAGRRFTDQEAIEALRKSEWPEYAIQKLYPETYDYPPFEAAA